MRRAGLLSTLAALSALGWGCSDVAGDFDRIIAIEIPNPLNREVEEGDTLTLEAVVLNASGEEVLDAQIWWAVLDIDSGQIGFTLDTTSGLVRGQFPSSARVQARFENLRSGPVTVTVTGAPDSISALSNLRLTTTATEQLSPAMIVQVLDVTTTEEPTPLANKVVSFSIVFPEAPSGVTLTQGAQAQPTEGTSLDVLTLANGNASAFLTRVTGMSQPDSAVVEASIITAAGQQVAGSPVTFVVEFEPSDTSN